MMGLLKMSRPLGDVVFHWIPACAGMAKGGAEVTDERQDTHQNYMGVLSFTWVSKNYMPRSVTE